MMTMQVLERGDEEVAASSRAPLPPQRNEPMSGLRSVARGIPSEYMRKSELDGGYTPCEPQPSSSDYVSGYQQQSKHRR